MSDLVVWYFSLRLSSVLFFLNQALDSMSFFSAQLSEDTEVFHGATVVFDLVVVNYASDYIQSGGTYL